MLLGAQDTLERRRAQGYIQTQDSSMELQAEADLSSPKPVLHLFHTASSPSLHLEIGLPHLDTGLEEDHILAPPDTQIVHQDILDDLPDSTFVETQIVIPGHQLEDTNSAVVDGLNPAVGDDETQIVPREVPHDNDKYHKLIKPSHGSQLHSQKATSTSLGDTQIVTRDGPSCQETQLIAERPMTINSQKLDHHLERLGDSPYKPYDGSGHIEALEDSILIQGDKNPDSNPDLNPDSLSRLGTQTADDIDSFSRDGNISDAQKEPSSVISKIPRDKLQLERHFSQEIPLLGFPEPPISQSSPTRAAPSASVVQIPNTVERNRNEPTQQLLAQVQNTQEDVVDVTFQKDQREERPVYLSSQKQEINTDESDVEVEKKNFEEELNHEDERSVADEKLLDEEIGIKFEQEDINIEQEAVGTKIDQDDVEQKKGKDDATLAKGNPVGSECEAPDIEALEVQQDQEQHSQKIIMRKLSRKRKLVLTDLQLLSDLGSQKRLLRDEALVTIYPEDIRHPHSVWAEYKFKMYPGIIIDSTKDTLTVKFDDLVSEIKNLDLHQLDIRVGDKLRYKNGSYEVSGLIEKIPKETVDKRDDDILCIRGYNHVYIRKVSKRRTAEILVPISRCYMEIEDWMEHQQKFLAPGLSTQLFFPPTRSRQNELVSDAILKPEEGANTNGMNLKLNNPRKGVFDKCLFLLTNNDDKRNDLQKKITDNGGTILELLEEIVSYKSTASGLKIDLEHLKHFRFAAVISSGFCRSAKYLQILAIGWPVLSNSFIYDTIKDGAFLLWPSYLLPAGQLQVLQTVTSCNIYLFRQNYEKGTTLDKQLSNNTNILAHVHVVVVKGKLEQAKINMDACKFIFHALGAYSLEFTTTLSQAMKKCVNLMETGEKCLVYINICNPETLKSHTTTTTNNANVKKRKRGGRTTANSSVNLCQVDIIDWEWVVQCVISSHAWNPTAQITA